MKWLGNAGVDVTFHDRRPDGVPAARLHAWVDQLGTAELINRHSVTWRGLDATQRARAESALEALLWEQPTLIRRPLLEHGETVRVPCNRISATGH